jgi:hypothetical protein
MLSIIVSFLLLVFVSLGGLLIWRSKLREKDKSENMLLVILLLSLLTVVSELKHYNYLTFGLSAKPPTTAESLFHQAR